MNPPSEFPSINRIRNEERILDTRRYREAKNYKRFKSRFREKKYGASPLRARKNSAKERTAFNNATGIKALEGDRAVSLLPPELSPRLPLIEKEEKKRSYHQAPLEKTPQRPFTDIFAGEFPKALVSSPPNIFRKSGKASFEQSAEGPSSRSSREISLLKATLKERAYYGGDGMIGEGSRPPRDPNPPPLEAEMKVGAKEKLFFKLVKEHEDRDLKKLRPDLEKESRFRWDETNLRQSHKYSKDGRWMHSQHILRCDRFVPSIGKIDEYFHTVKNKAPKPFAAEYDFNEDRANEMIRIQEEQYKFLMESEEMAPESSFSVEKISENKHEPAPIVKVAEKILEAKPPLIRFDKMVDTSEDLHFETREAQTTICGDVEKVKEKCDAATSPEHVSSEESLRSSVEKSPTRSLQDASNKVLRGVKEIDFKMSKKSHLDETTSTSRKFKPHTRGIRERTIRQASGSQSRRVHSESRPSGAPDLKRKDRIASYSLSSEEEEVETRPNREFEANNRFHRKPKYYPRGLRKDKNIRFSDINYLDNNKSTFSANTSNSLVASNLSSTTNVEKGILKKETKAASAAPTHSKINDLKEKYEYARVKYEYPKDRTGSERETGDSKLRPRVSYRDKIAHDPEKERTGGSTREKSSILLKEKTTASIKERPAVERKKLGKREAGSDSESSDFRDSCCESSAKPLSTIEEVSSTRLSGPETTQDSFAREKREVAKHKKADVPPGYADARSKANESVLNSIMVKESASRRDQKKEVKVPMLSFPPKKAEEVSRTRPKYIGKIEKASSGRELEGSGETPSGSPKKEFRRRSSEEAISAESLGDDLSSTYSNSSLSSSDNSETNKSTEESSMPKDEESGGRSEV